ncbi:toprim domain-containing protein [Candidatus Woesearchaeota archaeon]|nr:toprim domain-containing protein [Candidatus Woesearchaeota archaeon]
MEYLAEWLHYLKKKKTLILVEGKKDLAALQSLGIKNIQAIAQQPFYKIVESIQEKEIIILTDLDAEGKKLYAKLNQYCQQHGIKVDDKPREFLFKHTTLTQIEGLPQYLLTQNTKHRVKDIVFDAASVKRRS